MQAFHALAREIRALDTSRRALRSFGLVVGGVFVGIAGVIAWRHGWTLGPWGTGLGSAGTALVLLGLAAPTVLKPVYQVWMGIAIVLGAIMTRVLLTIVFVGIVTPIGLLLRLFGKDLLAIRGAPADSYWKPKAAAGGPERLERYY